MSAWIPSEGLKRADAIVGEIEQAIGACEAGPPGNVRRHRLMEIVARAIDDAMTDARNIAWVAPPANAVSSHFQVGGQLGATGHLNSFYANGTDINGHPLSATALPPDLRKIVTIPAKEPEAPKRRGRPAGSTNKKGKKSKAAKAETAHDAAE